MKKTMLIILAVLPIVLLVVIALTLKLVPPQHFSVDKIEFVDRLGNVYDSAKTYTIDLNSEKQNVIRMHPGHMPESEPDKRVIYIKIHPDLAQNKKITYTSQNPDICTVDENGVITVLDCGYTTIVAKSEDGNKTAMLKVLVKADYPNNIELSKEEISLVVGGTHTLNATVLPDAVPTANKVVSYTSDNEAVAKVNIHTGEVTAVSVGEATITATTKNGKTATCKVTVTEGILDMKFDFSGIDTITKTGEIYVSTAGVIDLLSALKLSENVNAEDVNIKITSGASRATLDENGVLTLNSPGTVTIFAYVGDPDSPDYSTTIKIALAT